MIFQFFSVSVNNFCPSGSETGSGFRNRIRNPKPDSDSEIGSGIRNRIRIPFPDPLTWLNPDPDPKHWFNEEYLSTPSVANQWRFYVISDLSFNFQFLCENANFPGGGGGGDSVYLAVKGNMSSHSIMTPVPPSCLMMGRILVRYSTLGGAPCTGQAVHPSPFFNIKGTVLRDRFWKCWQKFTDVGLKGRGWYMNFSEAPLMFSDQYCADSELKYGTGKQLYIQPCSIIHF